MHQIACYHCDLVHEVPALPQRATARCGRCGSILFRTHADSIDCTIAWTIAAFVLFLIAINFPFLGIKTNGIERHSALLTGVNEIYRQGMTGLSILVMLTCVISPVIQMTGLLYVFVPLKLGRKARYAETVFRLFQHIQPWNMMEVFMLGILVALVKLGDLATIIPGAAVYAFALLIFCLAFAVSSVDAHLVWKRIEELSHG